jgi:hypothetical protein
MTKNGTIKGDVTAQAGSHISGNATFNGKTLIEAGATQSPGNSPGTQAFNDLTWEPGSSDLLEINADVLSGGNPGTDPGWDWIIVTGNFDLSGINTASAFTIDITSLNAGNIAGDALGFDITGKTDGDLFGSFTILSFNTLFGNFDADAFYLETAGFSNSEVEWSIDLVGSDILFLAAYAAVPETNSVALLGLGSLGLAMLMRR